MNLKQYFDAMVSYLLDPAFLTQIKPIALICVGAFLAGALLRLIFGKKSTAVKSVTATLCILCIYCVTFLLQTTRIPQMYLPDLPFVNFFSQGLEVFALPAENQISLYIELIDLIVLVFICGLLEDILPARKGLFSWLFFKVICAAGTYAGFLVLQKVMDSLLPDFILTYAPVILLALLAVLLAVTVFKWLIGLILGVTGGPIVGAIYTFFISNIVGKQLTKSALTSAMIMGIVYLSNHFSVTSIHFDHPIGVILVPVIICICFVWYLVTGIFCV